MQAEVMCAGFGGQGIMMIGKLLALAGMDAGREVAWIPSYGPEMRGGTAYCMVVIADRPIGSPVVSNPAHLVVMNRPSLEKFAPVMKPGGVCLVNSSLITIGANRKDILEVRVPCNELANTMGDPRTLNIIALGAFAACSKMVDFELVRQAVRHQFEAKPKALELNMRALEAGAQAALKAAGMAA
ncbi:MAG: 2-oxoacid:ferredoxin oxidoreductase subunit gamma [Myxococcales bacterium]|nr:MAG: 2-oxoacid:ferredoxin oxidoreductase subunit gamma [Myxococcales bacterium]